MNRIMCGFLTVFWGLVGLAPAASAEQDGLVLMYNDLEPFVVKKGERVSGYLGDYLTRALDEAGVKVLWENVPWERQLPTLQANAENLCAVAIFKTSERLQYLKYTAPIASGTGFVLVARRGHQGLLQHDTFADVLADATLKPILQTQTTYTPYINKLLAGKDITKTKGSKLRMIRSLEAHQYDYLVMLKTRAESLLTRNKLTKQYALYSHYTDLGDRVALHVGCSLRTDANLFARFNGVVLAKGPLETDK